MFPVPLPPPPFPLLPAHPPARQVLALPSKREALYAPAGGTLIARSDANAEDLEQYAAAGLYDRCVRIALARRAAARPAPAALVPRPTSPVGWLFGQACKASQRLLRRRCCCRGWCARLLVRTGQGLSPWPGIAVHHPMPALPCPVG